MMHKLDINEIKQIEIDILDYFVDICAQNKLIYYLDAGTLLGAVRHNGFIPWDDDLDVIMPRADYERLQILFDSEGRYDLKSYKRDSSYVYPYMKLVDKKTKLIENDISYPGYGVFIDIFPLDNVPNDEKKRIAFQEQIWKYTNMIDYALDEKKIRRGFIAKTKKAISKLLGVSRIIKIVDRLASKYQNMDTEFAYDIIASTNKRRLVKRDVFIAAVKVTFEGKKYNAPVGFHAYLTELYGDYMTLPPKNEQVSNHDFQAYLME